MATMIEQIKAMLGGYEITSDYGNRIHPITKDKKMHQGIDLVSKSGSNAAIGAFVPGTVVYAGSGGTGYGGYGNTVAVKDSAGYTHLYGHLSSIGVKAGQTVGIGTIVGNQGSTGNSTGPHLHYEVRKTGVGDTVDPSRYLYTAAAGGGAVQVGAPTKGELFGPPKELMNQPKKSSRPGSAQFTLFGIVVFAAVLWLSAQSGNQDMKKTINGFLAVLLLSMILLNWNKISPIFFKQ